MKLKLLFRDIKSNFGLWTLSVFGIALGVAGWIAMKSSADLAVSSFEESVNQTVGEATHVIKSRSGAIDESSFARLSKNLSIPMSPVREDYARLKSSQSSYSGELIKVIGIEPVTFFNFYNLPNRLPNQSFPFGSFLRGKPVTVAAKGLAEKGELRIAVGSQTYELGVSSIIDQQEDLNTIYVDLGMSQELFDGRGKITKILLKDEDLDERSLNLPTNLVLRSSGRTSRSVQSLLNAYSLNLQALAFLALFVGAFLVYNTMILYSHRQAETLSLLRTIGMTSGDVLRFTFLSVFVLGIMGTILGLVLGILLSFPMSTLVVDSISSIVAGFFVPTDIEILWSLILGFVCGMVVTLFGGLDPVLRNWSITPREWQLRTELTDGTNSFTTSTISILALIGIGLLSISFCGVLLSERSIIAGHFACFSLSLAGSSLTVILLAGLSRVTLPGQWLTMAARNLAKHSIRSGVIVGSLVAAFSMVFAVTVLVDSFRQSVINWSQGNIKADRYISSVPGESTEADPILKSSFREELTDRIGMGDLSTLRKKTILNDEGHSIHLRGLQASIVERHRPLSLNRSLKDPFKKFDSNGVFLSEPGAYRLQKELGDTIVLPVAGKTDRVLPVIGVFNDYTPKYAIVYLNDQLMRNLYPNAKVRDVAVYDDRTGDQNDDLSVKEFVKNNGYVHETRQELRSKVLQFFEDNFAVTRLMKFLAAAIAILGLAVTLISFNQTRGEFFGRLRAAGANVSHLVRMISYEGLFLGGISLIGSIPTGYVLSYILIEVINRRSFGWSIRMSVDGSIPVELTLMMFFSVCIALIFPVYGLIRRSIPSLMGEE